MTVLDTSALIRFFTKDDVKKSLKVKNLIESRERVYIPEVVFAELEYVLRGVVYGEGKSKIVKAFKFLLGKENIKVSSKLSLAVQIYEQTDLDIADCLIISHAKNRKLLSFDKKMVRRHFTLS